MQIHKRTYGYAAVAAAAVAVVVTVPVLAVTGNIGADDRDPGSRPTGSDASGSPTDSDTDTGLSKANLLTDDDTVYQENTDWETADTYEGDGHAAFNPCTRSMVADLGADAVFKRDFEFVVTESGGGEQVPGVDPSLHLNELIAEFPDDEAARSAYDEIAGWLRDCTPAGSDRYDASDVHPVDLEVAGEAQQSVATFGPVDKALDPHGDEVYFLDTGLVLSGDRIAVLTQQTHGQDYNFEVTPVQRMLPAAAERLVDGGGATTEPSDDETSAPPTDDPTTSESAAPVPDADIAGDFPLAAGWPDSSLAEPGHGLAGPDRTLDSLVFTACGQTFEEGEYVDRLRANWTNIEDFRGRQLTTYEDAGAAVAAVSDLRAFYESCGAREKGSDGYTTHREVRRTDVGGESWAFIRTFTYKGAPAVGLEITHVVRVGRAVLAISSYSEGSAADVDATLRGMTDEAADPIAAMCAYAEAGC